MPRELYIHETISYLLFPKQIQITQETTRIFFRIFLSLLSMFISFFSNSPIATSMLCHLSQNNGDELGFIFSYFPIATKRAYSSLWLWKTRSSLTWGNNTLSLHYIPDEQEIVSLFYCRKHKPRWKPYRVVFSFSSIAFTRIWTLL